MSELKPTTSHPELSLLLGSGADCTALSAYLDGLTPEARISEVRGLSRPVLKTLYERCEKAPPLQLTDMVPALAEPVFGTLADRKVDLTALVRDDEALAEHIRQNVAGMFHVAGTCRMGAASDRDAVVDGTGRVRGFDGLRVVAGIAPDDNVIVNGLIRARPGAKVAPHQQATAAADTRTKVD